MTSMRTAQPTLNSGMLNEYVLANSASFPLRFWKVFCLLPDAGTDTRWYSMVNERDRKPKLRLLLLRFSKRVLAKATVLGDKREP